ncbi:MAG: HEAT repeat domain-containing protein [Promethearchaeota archaeon]
MFLELVNIKWYENAQMLSKIYQYLKEIHPSTEFRVDLTDQSAMKQNGNQLLESLALNLVHPQLLIRQKTVEFFNENFETSNSILMTEGNVIDELPSPLKNEVLEQLLEHYKTGNERYLIFATFWLGMYGDDTSLPFLIKNLSHPSVRIVKQTINALGLFGSPRSIPYLLPLIHDERIDAQIIHCAIIAIGILGDEGVGIQSLIHELYTGDSTDYSDLTDYLKTHGARILKYIACEIEYETNADRKAQLNSFYSSIAQDFSVMNSKKYNILL